MRTVSDTCTLPSVFQTAVSVPIWAPQCARPAALGGASASQSRPSLLKAWGDLERLSHENLGIQDPQPATGGSLCNRNREGPKPLGEANLASLPTEENLPPIAPDICRPTVEGMADVVTEPAPTRSQTCQTSPDRGESSSSHLSLPHLFPLRQPPSSCMPT